jgi:hypothetical protein
LRTTAVVVQRTGKEPTILPGFSLGTLCWKNNGPGATGMLRAVWQSAGVKPPIRVSTGASCCSKSPTRSIHGSCLLSF